MLLVAVTSIKQAFDLSEGKDFPLLKAIAQLGLARIEEAPGGDLVAGLALARISLAFFEPRRMPQRFDAAATRDRLEGALVRRLQKELPLVSLEVARDLLPAIESILRGEMTPREGKPEKPFGFRHPNLAKSSARVGKFLEVASPLMADSP